MTRQRPQYVAILGEIILSEYRHYAARIGHDIVEPHRVTDGKRATDLIVLNKPSFIGADDHVHTKTTRVKNDSGTETGSIAQGWMWSEQ